MATMGAFAAHLADFERAPALYEEYHRRIPRDKQALPLLRNAAEMRRLLEEALRVRKAEVEADSEDTNALYMLGLAYFRVGKLPQAAECLPKVTQLRPGDDEAFWALGLTLRQSGKKKESIARLEQALGDIDGAIATYEAVLVQDPSFTSAGVDLGKIYDLQGDAPKARQTFAQALGHNPKEAAALYNLGVFDQRQNLLAAAAMHYEDALKVDPRYAQAASNLGVVRDKLGGAQAAEAAFQRAIQLRPAYTDAMYNLGLPYSQVGQRDKALATRPMTRRVLRAG